MTILIKAAIIGLIVTFLSVIFPANIITLLNIPILSVQNFIHTVALFISQLCAFGDVFLIEGSTLLMVKALVLFLYFFGIFKILFPIIKLIVY